jgi:hypothetical protein
MLLVSDANIFIDFEVSGLTTRLFQLPHEIVVPDTLYEQELRARHPHLPGLGLQVRTLTSEQVAEVFGLQARYADPSVNDLFALVLAKGLGCPLATGDARLRKAADAEGLQLLGTLTLVDDMFTNELVTLEELRQAYGRMRDANRRLPWKEVDAQLERFAIVH